MGDGPFTVFAPTNEAFEALPAGVLDSLLMPENVATLKSILTFHVLPQEVMAADIKPGEMVTVQGEPATVVTMSKGDVTIQGAKITRTDVDASNGVIHVINQVLLPPSMSIDDFKKPAAADAGETGAAR